MKNFKFIVVFLSLYVFFINFTWAIEEKNSVSKVILTDFASEITLVDLENLQKGQHVVIEKELQEEVLPQFSLYMVLDITPLEAFAIFSDFEHQKEYVPNLILARIEKAERSNSIWVKYRMKTPFPLPDAKYITRNEIWTDRKGNYCLNWNQIKSNSTDETVGEARFLKYQENKTLFIYRNLIRPKISLASIFKGQFKDDMIETFLSSAREILRVKEKDARLLEWEVKLISEILDGKNPYGEGFQVRPIANS